MHNLSRTKKNGNDPVEGDVKSAYCNRKTFSLSQLSVNLLQTYCFWPLWTDKNESIHTIIFLKLCPLLRSLWHLDKKVNITKCLFFFVLSFPLSQMSIFGNVIFGHQRPHNAMVRKYKLVRWFRRAYVAYQYTLLFKMHYSGIISFFMKLLITGKFCRKHIFP